MTLRALPRGRPTSRITAMFRLLVASILLSGGILVFPSSTTPSGTCMVMAQKNGNINKRQNDKNNDKNNNKNNDKNNNKNNDKNKDNDKNKNKETESPTPEPTTSPTQVPTQFPTDSPTSYPTGTPTARPTGSPTVRPSYLAVLPQITFDIVTVVDDVFAFATLLEKSNKDEDDLLNTFFTDFLAHLLVASQVVSGSDLEFVDLRIQLLPAESETGGGAETVEASPKMASAFTNPNDTSMRIVIDGTMTYFHEVGEEGGEHSVLSLEDKMSHTLAVYFSFWSTDEVVDTMSEYGFQDPRIAAVRVDDNVILVAQEEGNASEGADASGNVGGNGLVMPNSNGGNGGFRDKDGAALVSSGHRVQSDRMATAVGSTLLCGLWAILIL